MHLGSFRHRTTIRLRDQTGQTLVLTVVAMTLVIAMGAFGISVASWYTSRNQAQSSADASALAAANCLANAGNTGDSCTSTTDTTHANAVATSIATADKVPISSVSYGSGSVTVTTATTAAASFAGAFHIGNPVVSAHAVAAYAAGSANCTSGEESAGQCSAIYAANQTCGTSDGIVANSTSLTVTGGVHSQGSMNVSNGTFTFNSPVTYSSGSQTGGGYCAYSAAQNGTEAGAYSPAPGGNEPAAYWPEDYSTIFTTCSASATYKCTGPGGTPSYCGNAAASYSFNYASSPTGIYCAYGTGTASTPSTWNGSYSFSNGAAVGSSSSPQALTMIGGAVSSTSSTIYIKAATGASNCVIYALDTDSQAGGSAVSTANGNFGLQGDVFAPNGTISINSSASSATFLEAKNVSLVNFSFTGDGPPFPGSGAATTGKDYLSQ